MRKPILVDLRERIVHASERKEGTGKEMGAPRGATHGRRETGAPSAPGKSAGAHGATGSALRRGAVARAADAGAVAQLGRARIGGTSYLGAT